MAFLNYFSRSSINGAFYRGDLLTKVLGNLSIPLPAFIVLVFTFVVFGPNQWRSVMGFVFRLEVGPGLHEYLDGVQRARGHSVMKGRRMRVNVSAVGIQVHAVLDQCNKRLGLSVKCGEDQCDLLVIGLPSLQGE